MLLNHGLLGSLKPEGAAGKDTDVQVLARARTLTALQGLDTERKGLLVKFLYEAKLIGFRGVNPTYAPIIDLSGADLVEANLFTAQNLTQQKCSQAKLAIKIHEPSHHTIIENTGCWGFAGKH